jgi:hypothetical protein
MPIVSPKPRMISVPLTVVPLSTQAQVPAETPCLLPVRGFGETIVANVVPIYATKR